MVEAPAYPMVLLREAMSVSPAKGAEEGEEGEEEEEEEGLREVGVVE